MFEPEIRENHSPFQGFRVSVSYTILFNNYSILSCIIDIASDRLTVCFGSHTERLSQATTIDRLK